MPTKKPVKKSAKPAAKREKQLSLMPPDRLKPVKLPMLHAWDEVTVKSLREYDQNPRVNQPVELVAQSLTDFGWAAPIIVDDQYVIICGHTRFKAAKHLGLTHVPVVVADGWTEAQVKAFRLMDNQTASVADWDKAFLTIELRDLDSLGYSSSVLGFSEDELAKITESAVKKLTAEPASGDGVDDIHVANAGFAHPEDVFELGVHQVICGHDNINLFEQVIRFLVQKFPKQVITRNGEPFTLADVA